MEPLINDNKKRFNVYVIAMIVLSVVFVSIALLNTFVYERVEVEGTSMSATLSDGDVLYYSKLSRKPEYEDIVIITGMLGVNQNGEENWIIKRVVGLPGDVIEIVDGKVYRIENGIVRRELSNYGHSYTHADTGKSRWELGENQIFYLGDNRELGGSLDARFFGPCTYENIVGIVPSWAITLKGFNTFLQNKIITPVKDFFSNMFSCSGT